MSDQDDQPEIPAALREAGAKVETLVAGMLSDGTDPLAAASAMLAGTMGLLMEVVGPEGAADVLRNALASIPPTVRGGAPAPPGAVTGA